MLWIWVYSVINLDSCLLCNHGNMFMAYSFSQLPFHALIGCKITINTSFIAKINSILNLYRIDIFISTEWMTLILISCWILNNNSIPIAQTIINLGRNQQYPLYSHVWHFLLRATCICKIHCSFSQDILARSSTIILLLSRCGATTVNNYSPATSRNL